jgi:hypothetical protein
MDVTFGGRRFSAGRYRMFSFGSVADLKTRVVAIDASNDEVAMLFFLQDFSYMSAERSGGYAPERNLVLWSEAISNIEDVVGEAEIHDIQTDHTGGLHPHVDVLIRIGDWIEAGVTALVVERCWAAVRSARNSEAVNRVERRASLIRDEALAYAIWMVEAQFLDRYSETATIEFDLPRLRYDDTVPKSLEDLYRAQEMLKQSMFLVAEEERSDGSFQFNLTVVRNESPVDEYLVEVSRPDGLPYVVFSKIRRRYGEALLTPPKWPLAIETFKMTRPFD